MRRFAPLLTAALLTATLTSLLIGSILLMAVMAVLLVGAAWPLLFQRVAATEVGWLSSGKLDTTRELSTPRTRPTSTRTWPIVRALGRVEARELVSSIWFGVGIGFSVVVNVLFAVVWGNEETHLWPDDAMLAPWYVHPLVGMTVLAVHRNVTRARRDGADELFDTCPTSPETRTWGFLATAWVPAVVGGAFYLSYVAILAGRGVDFDGPFGADQVFDIAGAPVLGLGGVALGVALGRWVHFGLAPVIAVVAVGVLSLGIATTGDPHWNPIAELSTFPPIETIDQLFLVRNNGGHIMWLLALTGLVVVIALARNQRNRSLAVAAVALVAVAGAGGILATRPISGAEAARIADHVANPAAHQSCLSGASGRLEVCTFEHYRDIGRAVVTPVSAIVEALPADAGAVMMRQRYLEGAVLADLPPSLRGRFPDGLPTRPSTEASLAFGLDQYEVVRARFEVAFLATGLSRESPPDDAPRVIAGQARGVAALWLATRGMDPTEAVAIATVFDPQSSDPFTRGVAWFEQCTTPLVVWSAQDLEAARALMAVPDSDVTRALAMDWGRWIDPDTGTDELLEAAGLEKVGPFDRFATRSESLGMLTVARSPTPASRSTHARAARIAAVRPTARVSQPWLVLVTVAIATAPLMVAVVRSPDDLTIPLVLLCLTAGASLGWTVDDPASEMLGPLPIDGPFRLRLRLAVAASLVGLVVTVAATVLEAVGPGLPPDAPARLAEAACAAAVAISIGLIAVRTGNRAVGAGAVTAGLLVPGVVAAFAVRWPATLPTFMTNSVHHRWWWLAVVGGALAVRLAASEPR